MNLVVAAIILFIVWVGFQIAKVTIYGLEFLFLLAAVICAILGVIAWAKSGTNRPW